MLSDCQEPDDFVLEAQKLFAKPDDNDVSLSSSQRNISTEDATTSSIPSQN